MPQELRKELIGLLNYLDWNYAGETHEDRVRQYLEATERIGEAGIKPDVSGELPTTKQWAKIEQDFYEWKNECENIDNSESWTPSNYELFNFIKNKIVLVNLR